MKNEHECGCTPAEKFEESARDAAHIKSSGCGCGGNCACGGKKKDAQGLSDFSEGRRDLGLSSI